MFDDFRYSTTTEDRNLKDERRKSDVKAGTFKALGTTQAERKRKIGYGKVISQLLKGEESSVAKKENIFQKKTK